MFLPTVQSSNDFVTPGGAVRTTCPYCGVGCGIIATPSIEAQHNITVNIKGDPEHPANFGRLCSKGAELGETLDLDGRLLYPEIGGQRTDWDTALKAVAEGFRNAIDEHGPDSVAFYVSGQLLTEDYYVANKLMKGFIGSANIDTNSRLCMASAVAGHKRAFGGDIVPNCYDDLEQADLIVLVGSNTAWCHPVLFQRIAQGQTERHLRTIVIDPRRTTSCDGADRHLALKPGTDTILFNGLLAYLRREDHLNRRFIAEHTEGFSEAIKAAEQSLSSIDQVAEACDLPRADVSRFYQLFARTKKVVTLFSQGVNQSSCGTDKVNSIINCHLATARIGKPGMGPFSITGQPNAMGGREVGGLANQLAAHMDFDDPQDVDRVARFWNTKTIARKPGLKAVDLFNHLKNGKVKAVWIMATNPAVSIPDASQVRTAMQACDLVVVSDCIRNTDTTAFAHILLPASAWGEKSGTVTNSERRISKQRRFLKTSGEARPDWWIITQVGRRMGYSEVFPYEGAAEIFREHARLSGFENDGTRAFDISSLSDISNDEYDALQPTQWPAGKRNEGNYSRPFCDGQFFTPTRKARFIPITPRPPVNKRNERYPLVLNTGRVRDHWHTLTRTGKSPRLSRHVLEPLAELHPDTAARYELTAGALVKVASQWGEIVVRVRLNKGQRLGEVFVPLHWNDQFAAKARVDTVVNPETDPISGQPEFKHTPIRVEVVKPAWEGFFLTRDHHAALPVPLWVKAIGRYHWSYELAGTEVPEHWSDWARALLKPDKHRAEWAEFIDDKAGRYRAACIKNSQLQSCLFIARRHIHLPSRSWLASLFERHELEPIDRASLLAGRPATGYSDTGPTVCSCFNIGRHTILAAIEKGNLQSIEVIGDTLKAGTNCGSCIPELKEMLYLNGTVKDRRHAS